MVALLAAGVVAVPIFRRMGLGSVLGYLAAGLARAFSGCSCSASRGDPAPSAELGVVMFLFIIGLEMEPRGSGACASRSSGSASLQVGVCGAAADRRSALLGFPAVGRVRRRRWASC